jgi:dienelactone hydrolase
MLDSPSREFLLSGDSPYLGVLNLLNYRIKELNKNRTYATLIAILSLLFSGISFAKLDNPPTVPILEIRSVSQTITVSGDPVEIYYPDPAGSAAGYRFPVVVYLQGAQVDKQYYSQFAQQLSSYGFIVVVPNHTGLFTSTMLLTEAFDHLKLEDVDPNSSLYGIVDASTLVASGHSMGGAAALGSLNNFCLGCGSGDVFVRPVELKAVVVTAGNTGPVDLDNEGIPVAIVVGDLNNSQQKYDQTYAALKRPRALMYVHGANHYGMADMSEPPGAVIPEEPAQIIPQSITAARFAHWSGLYLRTWLYHDFVAWWQLESGGDEFVTVTTD